MYQIISVSKYFKTKQQTVHALKNINLTLPDTGLVFITGRSGTGKSTFLNLLGGLDIPNRGQIYFDNIEITSLQEKDLAKYRNEQIGFVFQDFALIESMTVYDNIVLALEIQHKDDKEKIKTIMEELQISSLKDRLVTKLSGGQKQRVAIARAIVKSPKVILADEPTGNLDTESGSIVLKYLKKVSKDTLVVIISHNMSDAYQYADRIIKLDNGNIVKDIITNYSDRNYVKKNNVLYLNDVKEFNEKDLNKISDYVSQNKVKSIKPIKELFVDNKKETPITESEIKLNNRHLKTKNVFKLFKNLMAKQIFHTFTSSLVSMALICVMALCEMLIVFSSSTVAIQSMESTSYNDLVLVKHQVKENGENEKQLVNEFTQEEKDDFSSCSYLINYDIGTSMWIPLTYGSLMLDENNFSSFYSISTYGVLVTDKDYVSSIFETDDVEFVLEADEYKQDGIYITDYFADSLIASRKCTYADLVGTLLAKQDSQYIQAYVNGIIKTNYKTRYEALYNKYLEALNSSDFVSNDTSSDEYIEYLDYTKRYLAIAYSFESDFLKYIKKTNYRTQFYLKNASVDFSSFNLSDINFGKIPVFEQTTLESNQIILPVTKLNSLCKASYNAEQWNEKFKGKTFDFTYTTGNNVEKTLLVELVASSNYSDRIFISSSFKKIILGDLFYTYGAYFKDKEKAIDMYKKYYKKGVSSTGVVETNASRISNIVTTYKNFFVFIASILLIAAIFSIISTSYSSIKRKKYDIGVLKAIGTSSRDLNNIYVINIIIQLLFNAVFYTAFIFLFKATANYLLVAALLKAAGVSKFSFEIFVLTKKILVSNIILIAVSTIIGGILPFIQIRKIKPIDIIRCKY